MLSLQFLINKIANCEQLPKNLKRATIRILNFLSSCVNFGFFYSLTNAKNTYENIFVYVYLSMGEFKTFYFKTIVNYIADEYLDILFTNFIITIREYADFISLASDMDLH